MLDARVPVFHEAAPMPEQWRWKSKVEPNYGTHLVLQLTFCHKDLPAKATLPLGA